MVQGWDGNLRPEFGPEWRNGYPAHAMMGSRVSCDCAKLFSQKHRVECSGDVVALNRAYAFNFDKQSVCVWRWGGG